MWARSSRRSVVVELGDWNDQRHGRIVGHTWDLDNEIRIDRILSGHLAFDMASDDNVVSVNLVVVKISRRTGNGGWNVFRKDGAHEVVRRRGRVAVHWYICTGEAFPDALLARPLPVHILAPDLLLTTETTGHPDSAGWFSGLLHA